ncbi:hypothetical protein [Rahnella sp. PCH160]|uniref:hypothetical protein n=1 Tax=Rahnella sp. PCH160 TaxID=3447928 RepID=UPI0039FC75AD
MNEQANKVIAELLQKAVEGVDAAVNFSQAQIPDVIHQLLVWKFTISLIVQVICMLVITVIVILISRGLRNRGEPEQASNYSSRKAYKNHGMFWDEDGDLAFGGGISLLLAGLAILIATGIFLSGFDWLQIWIAPKLYLIEYAANLISK